MEQVKLGRCNNVINPTRTSQRPDQDLARTEHLYSSGARPVSLSYARVECAGKEEAIFDEI